VLVEVEHEVVGNDRVAGGEEGDQPAEQVSLGRGDALGEVAGSLEKSTSSTVQV
jgi:hypothetical protein